jgi:hypothetical protein
MEPESAVMESGFVVMEPEFAVMEPGSGLYLVVDLAAAVPIVNYHQGAGEMRSREKARDEPTVGLVVNAQVFHLVW